LQIDRRAEVLDGLVGPEASRQAEKIGNQDAQQKTARKNDRVVEFIVVFPIDKKEVQAEVRLLEKKVLVLVYHQADQDDNQHGQNHL
jgi:hypothetical protein